MAAVGAVTGIIAVAQGMSASRDAKRAAREEARFQEEKAALEVERHQRSAKRILGEQRVGYARAGVSVASGSAMDVFADTMSEIALDTEIIKYGGEASARRAISEGKAAANQATATMISGINQAGTSMATLLTKPSSPTTS